jgi:hypothetical protein
MVDKNGDRLCALSVTCHEKMEFFGAQILVKLAKLAKHVIC